MEICCSPRSTSSVWGSAWSHVHSFSRRSPGSTDSGRESRVSLNITSKSGPRAQITGSRDVVCKTPAEYKANKLNRNEQTKLDNITVRVVKEREIARRKFQQSERMLRAKSAKIAKRIQTLESSSYVAEKPLPYAYERRPKSEQFSRRALSSDFQNPEEKHKCNMCDKIQQVIKLYEKEGGRSGTITENGDHSTCLFSDLQMRNFINLLEAKYFSDSPDLSNTLRESGVSSSKSRSKNGIKHSKEEINNNIAKRNVGLRIERFCRDLDLYKKTHAGIGIPKKIQEHVEKIRLENAVSSIRQIPTKREQMRTEVEEILRL